MEEITYNINEVTNKLAERIANLEIQLAHEQAIKEAYMEKLKELEGDKVES